MSFDRTWQSYYSLIFEVLYYIIFRVNYFFILPIIQKKNTLKIGHKETNLLFQKSNLKHSFFIIVHKQFTILQLHATIKTFAFVIIRITINILMVIKNGTREFNLLPVARRSSFNWFIINLLLLFISFTFITTFIIIQVQGRGLHGPGLNKVILARPSVKIKSLTQA